MQNFAIMKSRFNIKVRLIFLPLILFAFITIDTNAQMCTPPPNAPTAIGSGAADAAQKAPNPCDANDSDKKNSDGQDDNGSNNSHGPQGPADDLSNNGDPTWPIDVTVPGDPNEMISPDGYDSAHWVSVKDNMGFTVLFENDPKIATAPAHDVYIYCPINEHQDMSTFRLGDFGFNEDVFSVPTNTSYYTKRLDLRDSLGV